MKEGTNSNSEYPINPNVEKFFTRLTIVGQTEVEVYNSFSMSISTIGAKESEVPDFIKVLLTAKYNMLSETQIPSLGPVRKYYEVLYKQIERLIKYCEDRKGSLVLVDIIADNIQNVEHGFNKVKDCTAGIENARFIDISTIIDNASNLFYGRIDLREDKMKGINYHNQTPEQNFQLYRSYLFYFPENGVDSAINNESTEE